MVRWVSGPDDHGNFWKQSQKVEKDKKPFDSISESVDNFSIISALLATASNHQQFNFITESQYSFSFSIPHPEISIKPIIRFILPLRYEAQSATKSH
jgi:hypothetical protein